VAKRLDRGKWAPFRRIATQWGEIYFGDSFNSCFSNWKVAGSIRIHKKIRGNISHKKIAPSKTILHRFWALQLEKCDTILLRKCTQVQHF
jgi:hypothetical protein